MPNKNSRLVAIVGFLPSPRALRSARPDGLWEGYRLSLLTGFSSAKRLPVLSVFVEHHLRHHFAISSPSSAPLQPVAQNRGETVGEPLREVDADLPFRSNCTPIRKSQ
jgi:hypothetical protein